MNDCQTIIWSSSTSALGTDDAEIVNFPYGSTSVLSKNSTTYTWPVRGGQ